MSKISQSKQSETGRIIVELNKDRSHEESAFASDKSSFSNYYLRKEGHLLGVQLAKKSAKSVSFAISSVSSEKLQKAGGKDSAARQFRLSVLQSGTRLAFLLLLLSFAQEAVRFRLQSQVSQSGEISCVCSVQQTRKQHRVQAFRLISIAHQANRTRLRTHMHTVVWEAAARKPPEFARQGYGHSIIVLAYLRMRFSAKMHAQGIIYISWSSSLLKRDLLQQWLASQVFFFLACSHSSFFSLQCSELDNCAML